MNWIPDRCEGCGEVPMTYDHPFHCRGHDGMTFDERLARIKHMLDESKEEKPHETKA